MRVWLLSLALLLPMPALALASVAGADWLARRAAIALDHVTGSVIRNERAEPSWVYVEPESETAHDSRASASVSKATGARKAVPKKGVRVRADTVLRLANAGARPSGIPVPAHGERPAGLALSGVSGLGIGLVDGDVLTQADGRPALAPGDVIGIVIAARAQKAPEICGRFWRGGEPWNLIVEQPYLQRKRPFAEPGG